MGVIGGLREYADFQAAEAMTQAASNPGGGASDGVGLGMGIAIANRMSESLGASGSGVPAAGPPRIPVEARFYVAVNGHQTGPYTLAEMSQKVSSNDVTPESLVWTNGMSEWQTANTVGDLKKLFASQPPPLPTK